MNVEKLASLPQIMDYMYGTSNVLRYTLSALSQQYLSDLVKMNVINQLPRKRIVADTDWGDQIRLRPSARAESTLRARRLFGSSL